MNCKDAFCPPTLDGEREMKQKFIAFLIYTTHLPIYLCYIFRGLQVALLLKS